jgi:arabinogalactan endo-1,4-beta-galactosidase
MKKIVLLLIGILIFMSCSDDNRDGDSAIVADDTFIRAADMSFLPEIEADGKVLYNAGQPEDALLTLKNAGVNTIRIRLWKNPATVHSGFAEVKAFAQRVRQAGMKVWLTVHYSDIWADPSAQAVPAEWQNLSLVDLTNAAKDYTHNILSEIKPDIIQIGNETNAGFMYPLGNLTTNEAGYLQLLSGISSTIRQDAPNTKIMLHHAGLTGAEWFFNKTANIDYDYIGLSYYPVWHGKDLNALKSTMNTLSAAHNKEVIIAETSYPFTLGYNDFTNNIIGSEDQLIPAYPATPQGQKAFLLALRNVVQTSSKGIGFCYWGGEWIAFKGNEATNGSSYENQALWNFTSNALPALDAFKKEL